MKPKATFSKKNKKFKPNFLGVFLLFLTGIFLSVVLSEFMIRKFVSYPLEKEYMRFRHLADFRVPERVRDEELFWTPKTEYNEINYEPKKKEGVFRIICIGDSVIQSHTENDGLLPRGSTIPFVLEKLLNKRDLDKKFEVINAGIGGYSSLQGLRYLKSRLLKYNPDLVISWFGVNDHTPAIFFTDKEQRFPGPRDLKNKHWIEHSSLYLFFKNIIFFKKKGLGVFDPLRRVSFKSFYINCEEMISLGSENNFQVVFVIPFEIENKKLKYYEEYEEQLEKLKYNHDCTVLDVAADLKAYGQVYKLFIDQCHPTPEGNKLIASIIYKSLYPKIKEMLSIN